MCLGGREVFKSFMFGSSARITNYMKHVREKKKYFPCKKKRKEKLQFFCTGGGKLN
jgi:hypothetical protein